MKRIYIWCIIYILAFAFSGCAHTPKDAGPASDLDTKVNIQEAQLDNGLKVLVLEDHSAKVATVQVWYRVGSRNEHIGIRGLAHLCEHMMFKGSENVGPEDHARIIDSVGGSENAFTSEDVTAYFNTISSDRLELAIELEAERMARIKLDESHFYKEREVVKEEIRKYSQNNPIGVLLDKFRNLAFEKHPYNWTVGGTLEDLDKITLEDLKKFRQTYYAPNNAILIVVGDTSFDQVVGLANKHFGPIKAQAAPPPVTIKEPEQKEYRRKELHLPTQLPIVVGGYKVSESAHQDAAVLEVIHQILGGGRSARIHKDLVREKQLAVFAGAINWKFKDPGLFLVFGGFLPHVPGPIVEDALVAQVEKLGREGPSPEELTKAKNQLTAGYIFKLTSMENLGFEIGDAETVDGDYREFIKGAGKFDAVSAADIKRVIAKYLTKERLTVAVLLPPKQGEQVEKAAATEIKQAEQKTTDWPTNKKYLDLGKASAESLELPQITRVTLKNGLKVLIVERHEQPVVYFDLTIPGGQMLDPKGQSGLSGLLAQMLTQGTKTRSAEQIALEVEMLGGHLGAWSSEEFIAINGQFLKRDFNKGLELLADVTLEPTFPQSELAKVRPMIEGGVRMIKDQPAAMAAEHMRYLIFGYDHPKGRPTSLETLKAIDIAKIKELYKKAIYPKGAILTIAGDVDAKESVALVEKTFGNWQNDTQAYKWAEEPNLRDKPIVRVVDKPDLTQATIALGQLGISRDNADYFKLLLGNWILGGGGFSSRLMKTIRSQGGKTYGVASGFSTGRSKGLFIAHTFTRNKETKNTLKMLVDEITKIQKEGVTQKELTAAKNNLAGSYSLRLQPIEGMANELSAAEFYGLGDEWVRLYRQHVNAPTIEDVNLAIKTHLKPDKLNLVVVGKAEEILEQVTEFGKVEKIEYLDAVPDEERTKSKE
jgi:zinc protease